MVTVATDAPAQPAEPSGNALAAPLDDCCAGHVPSKKEIAAALAARARLYGEQVPDDLPSAAPASLLPSGEEPRADVEVAYPSRSELEPLEGSEEEVQGALRGALEGCSSKDWAENVKALGLLRRVVALRPEQLQGEGRPTLEAVVTVVLAHVRSLRSAVSKTAILAASDLFQSYGDALLPCLDLGGLERPLTSLLHQLLLKASSNEKRFVVDAASESLQSLVASTSAPSLLPLVLPYCTRHKNPKVRAKAGLVLAKAVQALEPETQPPAPLLEPLLRAAAFLVKDNGQEARDAGKAALARLKALHGQGEGADWEAHVTGVLGAAGAIAVLKL